jgi:hypothetical protein
MYLLQTDLNFWAAFVNNPLGLFMVIIGTVLVVLAMIVLPKYIGKKAEIEIKKIESKERTAIEENNQLIINMGNVAGRIENSMNELNQKYEKLSTAFADQERSITRMSRQTDMLVVRNDDMEILDRLIAFNWCLKSGKNGKTFDIGFKLILANKSIWAWILEHDRYKQPENEKYQKLLEKIERALS